MDFRIEAPVRSSRAFGFMLVAVLSGVAANAHAQDPTAADKETARGLMDEGNARRDRKDLKAALESFRAADSIMHVPSTGLEVGRTYAAMGLLVEARDKLLDVVRSPPKPNEPAAFAEARAAASALSDDLEARIPAIHIVLRGIPEGSTPQVTVDNAVIPPAALIAWRKLNPGHHDVVAHAGALDRREDVLLRERDKKEVVIDFTPPAVVATTPPPTETPAVSTTSPPPPPGSDSTPSAVPWKTLAYVGFGVGAAGIITGTITGLISISDTNSAKNGGCAGNQCPPQTWSDIDAAKTTGTISTIAFIVGGAGVGLGVVSLIMNKSSSSASTTATVTPWIGAGSAGVRGAF